MKSTLFAVLLTLTASALAEPQSVYFGTGGKGAKGIYRGTFDAAKGRLTPVSLAAEIGSPGFLAEHPAGGKLYAVARWGKSAGVVGYEIKAKGELVEFTRQINPDGGGAHIAVHPSGKFLLTAQYVGGSIAFFPLDGKGGLGKPVVHEHKGGSKVVAGRQNSPHPHWCGFSPDAKYAFVPDLGTDQIHIYKIVGAKNIFETKQMLFPVEPVRLRSPSCLVCSRQQQLPASQPSWCCTTCVFVCCCYPGNGGGEHSVTLAEAELCCQHQDRSRDGD